MNKKFRYFVVMIMINACSVSPAPSIIVPNMSDAEAVRRVDGLTATSNSMNSTLQAMSTQNANATAIRVRESQLLVDGMTQDAHALAMAATSGSLTATPQAGTSSAQSTSTSQAATSTREATIEAQAAQLTAATLEDNKQWGETIRAIAWAVTVVMTIVFSLVGIFAVITMREFADVKKTQIQAAHEMQMLSMRLAALADGMRETHAGTVLFDFSGSPLVLPPASPISGSSIVSDIPQTQPIIVNQGNEQYTLSRLTPAEISARDDVLEWIDLSISWHDAKGKPGAREHQLKRHNHIGKDGDWQNRLTGYLGHSVTVSGAGTFVSNGATLGELRRRLKAGEISLFVEHPERTRTEQNAYEQAKI